ncbi:MAG: DTW domain-containing protein YfiP, partial [Bacteriovoracaceae bacterium]
MNTNNLAEAGRCYSCFRSKKACLCDEIKCFDTKTKIVILIHPKEAKKQRIGTGRLTQKSLSNSMMIMGVDFTDDNLVNALINDQSKRCFLLYPGEEAINLSQNEAFPKGRDLENVIFVLDGTWPCAKKMLRESKNLQALPRVCFDANESSKFSIKHQPAEGCLSTIESVSLLLNELSKQKVELSSDGPKSMIETLDKLVKFQRECAADPEKP